MMWAAQDRFRNRPDSPRFGVWRRRTVWRGSPRPGAQASFSSRKRGGHPAVLALCWGSGKRWQGKWISAKRPIADLARTGTSNSTSGAWIGMSGLSCSRSRPRGLQESGRQPAVPRAALPP